MRQRPDPHAWPPLQQGHPAFARQPAARAGDVDHVANLLGGRAAVQRRRLQQRQSCFNRERIQRVIGYGTATLQVLGLPCKRTI